MPPLVKIKISLFLRLTRTRPRSFHPVCKLTTCHQCGNAVAIFRVGQNLSGRHLSGSFMIHNGNSKVSPFTPYKYKAGKFSTAARSHEPPWICQALTRWQSARDHGMQLWSHISVTKHLAHHAKEWPGSVLFPHSSQMNRLLISWHYVNLFTLTQTLAKQTLHGHLTPRYNRFFALYPIKFTVGRSGHPKTHP